MDWSGGPISLSWTLAALQTFAVLLFGWSMIYAKAHRLDVRMFSHLQVDAWHHLYLGVALWSIGLVWDWPAVEVLGCVLTCDDAFQHAYQAYHHRVRYRSPLHRLWLKVYALNLPWLARITTWLDDFFSSRS